MARRRRISAAQFGVSLIWLIGLLITSAAAEPAGVVPKEDYAFYDTAVTEKFLTSRTKLVVIERMTTARLHPELPAPPPMTWSLEQGWFDGRLPEELLRAFLAANQRSVRVEGRFSFGARYRFVSADGRPETEAGLPIRPVLSVQELEGELDRIDRLAFSRVGRTLRGDQALLYVANPRRDGTGAGFLLWFVNRQGVWEVVDTEVIWAAQRDPGPPDPP